MTGAGLAPLPVQRPIPVWIGAVAPAALRRVGRLADGWFPQVPPGPKLDEARAIVSQAAVEAGRDPDSIGIEGRVSWTAAASNDWSRKPGAGATPARPTCPSTRWAPDSDRSTSTSRCWSRRATCSSPLVP